MIRLVKHPNIIELLATYKILDKHSMLFPLAQMDLKDFLKTKPAAPFDDNRYLFQSMRDLASALETIHNPSICQLGYHRDIKPGNILLIDNVFKITDFGLARFKPHTNGDTTKSQYCGGDNIYGAPDRIPTDDTVDRPKVGRKYDVWSLGCVFLDLASFVARGPEGVEQFRAKRYTKVGCVSDEMYYVENRTPEGYQADVKKEVLDWIVELKHESEGELSLILDIIRRMLKGKPEERPTAEEVRQEFEIILSQGISIFSIAFLEFYNADIPIQKAREERAGPSHQDVQALLAVVRGGHEWVASCLLEGGADPNYRSGVGWTSDKQSIQGR